MNVELEDFAILTALIFVLFSIAVFWKLYFFNPPMKSFAEFELQRKSHDISNEAMQLQSRAKDVKLNDRTLELLVEAMQHRRRNGHD